MSDELVLTEAGGTITVPAATLSGIAAKAAERVDGARVRRPRRNADVKVSGAVATVTLQLTARYGSALPQLAEDVQRQVAAALAEICGLEVRRVDVGVEELA